MARLDDGRRVPVWVQPADRALVQGFADLCATTTATYGQPVFQITASSLQPSDAVPENSFIQHGSCWNITYGPESVHVFDSVGMRSIAHLLGAPHQQVSVLELSMRARNTDTTLAPHLTNAPQEMIDRVTLSSVMEEVNRLQSQIDEARELGQEQREEETLARLDELVDSIQPSRGKLGRSRPVIDNVERARQAVHKSVRRAVTCIRPQAPRLATHLKQSITISRYCSYAPAQVTNWLVTYSSPNQPL